MANKTLERAKKDLFDIVVDGVTLNMPDSDYLTSDEIYNALENKGYKASKWGRCVWSQCDYSRK